MASRPVEVFSATGDGVIDACPACRLFWFDRFENISLTPRAVLGVFQYIGSVAGERIVPLASRFDCPRCHTALAPTRDLQRTTPFTYWRCDFNHGRLISFNQFLREKNFIRAPSPAELVKLRETVRQISCSQCGAPIDLATASACGHCGAPIALIDPDSVAKAIQQLSMAAGAGTATGGSTDMSRTAISDAQIDALFDIERRRLHSERDERVDVLAVGTQAIGALIGAFLTLSH
jgi:hypothetical protein